MEIRRTYSGTSLPKGLMVLLAIIAVAALAAAGGLVTRNLSGSGASIQTVAHPAPGTVLRQDNPAQGALSTTKDEHGPNSDLTRALPTKPAANDSDRDAGSKRFGGVK